MIAALLLTGVLVPQDFEVPAREIDWEELSAAFDRAWTLPDGPSSGRDLLLEMRDLIGRTFEVESGAGVARLRLGDLVAEARGLEGEGRERWWQDLGARAPKLVADWGAGLSELFFDDQLRSKRWNPDRDHPRDGILVADGWELDGKGSPPWSELDVEPRFEQAAALFLADLASIKEAENDYRRYPERAGADYEEIFPIADEHVRGADPYGRPFCALAIQFRCDLPFPFSKYTCRLQILNRIDEEGLPRTDIYSVSPDFHWLAGRDVFLPVADSAGDWVAFLVVRDFGFDLDGVPDKASHRLGAMRASLGNLKRDAEARFRAATDPATAPEDFTSFPVLGRR